MNNTVSPRYPSYLVMVIKAILSSPEKRLLLQEIYAYIRANYKEVIENHSSWQNSVRHNLSNHGCFYKLRNMNHGASFWGIYSIYIPFFEKQDYSRRWATGPKRRQQPSNVQNHPIPDNSMPINFKNNISGGYNEFYNTPMPQNDHLLQSYVTGYYFPNQSAQTNPVSQIPSQYCFPQVPNLMMNMNPVDLSMIVTTENQSLIVPTSSYLNGQYKYYQ